MFGIDGFLHTRASFMLDFVALAMAVVLPALGFSVWLVKRRRQFLWHKRMQLALGCVLLAAVVAFETDMRLYGWRERAKPSPYYTSLVAASLGIHLVFSVSTALLWVFVITQALRRFQSRPAPAPTVRGISFGPGWRRATWRSRRSPAGFSTGWRSCALIAASRAPSLRWKCAENTGKLLACSAIRVKMRASASPAAITAATRLPRSALSSDLILPTPASERIRL